MQNLFFMYKKVLCFYLALLTLYCPHCKAGPYMSRRLNLSQVSTKEKQGPKEKNYNKQSICDKFP